MLKMIAAAAGLCLAAATPAAADCYLDAAARYQIHPDVLRAIADVESGRRLDAENVNPNGTRDYCAMQINDVNVKALAIYDIKPDDLKANECTCVYSGAWVLSGLIARYGNTWTAIAAYNVGSPADPAKADIGRKYAYKVYLRFLQLTSQPFPSVPSGPLFSESVP